MVKIIFEKQERDAMESFKKLPELKKLIIKMKDSSYSEVRHELLNLASKHDHLSRYKFTDPWISRRKFDFGVKSDPSIVVESMRKTLAEKLKKRLKNRFISFTTTDNVKSYWKDIFKNKPSKKNLIEFKAEFGFKTVWNPTTKKEDMWVMKK